MKETLVNEGKRGIQDNYNLHGRIFSDVVFVASWIRIKEV